MNTIRSWRKGTESLGKQNLTWGGRCDIPVRTLCNAESEYRHLLSIWGSVQASSRSLYWLSFKTVRWSDKIKKNNPSRWTTHLLNLSVTSHDVSHAISLTLLGRPKSVDGFFFYFGNLKMDEKIFRVLRKEMEMMTVLLLKEVLPHDATKWTRFIFFRLMRRFV